MIVTFFNREGVLMPANVLPVCHRQVGVVCSCDLGTIHAPRDHHALPVANWQHVGAPVAKRCPTLANI